MKTIKGLGKMGGRKMYMGYTQVCGYTNVSRNKIK
jgi:hypothetical protein